MPNSHWYFTFFPIQIPTRVIWWRLPALQRTSKQENSGLNANTWEYISYEFPLGRHFCFAKASAPRWQWLQYPSAEPSDMMVPHSGRSSGRQRPGRGQAMDRLLQIDLKYASLNWANSDNMGVWRVAAAWSHSIANVSSDAWTRCSVHC